MEAVKAIFFLVRGMLRDRATLALAEERSRMPFEECEIALAAIGDGAVVVVPFELFTEWGMEIKKHSPSLHTLLIELANGYSGYLPTRAAFSRAGGYETRTLRSSKLAPDAGELVVRAVSEMLNRLG